MKYCQIPYMMKEIFHFSFAQVHIFMGRDDWHAVMKYREEKIYKIIMTISKTKSAVNLS